MKREHKNFIRYLSKSAPILAAVLESHWLKGERYYIDARVDIKGHRREFNRLNKQMKGE
jgi:hypothetical protein